MPKPNNQMPQKANDFKAAIQRLFRELNIYKILLITAFTLAILGSILSILAPNQLSKLTDKITEGLTINQENLKELQNKIDTKSIQEKTQDILKINLSQTTIQEITQNPNASNEDKQKLAQILKNIQTDKNAIKDVSTLSETTQKIILPKTTYKGVTITTKDKIKLLNMDKLDAPKSVQKVLFNEIKIDGTKISSEEQYAFISAMSTLKKDANVNDVYKKLDKMPESIKKVIEPKMDFTKIKQIVMLLICMYLLSATFTYIQSICMANVSNKFAKALRGRISKKINKLPLKYYDKHKFGDILSRITNDIDTIAQSMNQSLASLISSVTLFLGTIIMMFITNWVMALTAILSCLIGFLGMVGILKKSQKYFLARQKELGNLNGHIEEIYSGLNVVKAYNAKNSANQKFEEYNQKVCEANKKSQFLSGIMQPMMMFIGNFGYVAVCIVGALLALNGHITFGVIVAFITYVRLFTSPLGQMAQAMTSLQSTAAASERVFEFLDEEEMSNQKEIAKTLDKTKVQGKIEFQNVQFKYDGNEKPTINGFTATAEKGQKIAIVGPTGAGKTTLVNLLMKFYEINGGDIKIDGVSTKELTRENIHSLFTMVLQDTWLFEGTIKENIIYNRQNINNEKVEEVCKEVGLDHFIRTLENGYNTVITEGSISSGQKQLLTIARGMLEDSPFLILDEATSNVDTRTEELVQKAMDKLTKGKTSFIIAHRLSTIKNADLILVMNNGNIVEQGNHEELMKLGGEYAKLYNSQFEL